MKTLFVIAIFTLVNTAFAADDQQVRAGLFEVQSAQNQVGILFNEVNAQQKERVRYISQKLALAESYLQQSLNQYPTPPNQPPANETKVEMFRSDNCSDDLVGIINSSTDCSRFNGAGAVWAIRVNGKCQDVDDTNAVNACRLYQNAGQQNAIRVFKSDNCSESMVAAIDQQTQCESLVGLDSVWAIQTNGQCQDVSDLDVVTACKRFKP